MQLIIPACNEERRLPATLRALRAYALSTGTVPRPPLEVLVVDNGSTDRTAEVAASLDSPAMRVRVLHCAEPGKGAAVRAGIAAATSDVVGFMDADGATDLAAFEAAAVRLAAGADVVIGSRAAEGAETEARHTRLRSVGAGAYRRAAAVLVPGIADTQCGFKIFRGDLARDVFAATETAGFSFDVEVLARCLDLRARVEEIPVVWTDVPGSTFSPLRHGLRSFADLLAIGWRLRRRPTVATRPTPLRPGLPPEVSRELAEPGLRLVGER
ncbi:MAG: glycosyltransferase [Nocardioidaceae bacterium]|nr:glycosyltransferase [Nocardioidaceae bacterium]